MDRVRGSVRIGHQIEKGLDRLRVGIFQVDGIEIQFQPRQCGGGKDGEHQGRRDHPAAPAIEEAIRLGSPGKARSMAIGAGPQQRQQSRQQREVQDQGDDHADSGDQPQIPHSEVIRRCEGQEAGGGGGGRHGQGWPHSRSRALKGVDRFRHQPLRRIAHAELDPEIDRDPDKKGAKRDRNRIERSDHPNGKGGAAHEPDDQGQQNRQHRPSGSHADG